MSSVLTIRGGVPLTGRVHVRGAKNLVPKAMVAALRARGVPVEYRLFAGERHGFRQAANLAEALRAEWSFYQRLG